MPYVFEEIDSYDTDRFLFEDEEEERFVFEEEEPEETGLLTPLYKANIAQAQAVTDIGEREAKLARQMVQSVQQFPKDVLESAVMIIENPEVAKELAIGIGGIYDPKFNQRYEKAEKKQEEAYKQNPELKKQHEARKKKTIETIRMLQSAYPEVEEGRPFGVFSDAINGMLEFAPNMLMITLPGGQVISFEAMAAQIAGNKYDQLIKEGKDKKVAADAALFTAMWQAPLEYAGTITEVKGIQKIAEQATKKLSPKLGAYIRTIITQGALPEGLEEGAQEIVDIIADTYANDPEASPKELAKRATREIVSPEGVARIGKATSVGALGGTMLVGGMATAQAVTPMKAEEEVETERVKGFENKFRQGLTQGFLQSEILYSIPDKSQDREIIQASRNVLMEVEGADLGDVDFNDPFGGLNKQAKLIDIQTKYKRGELSEDDLWNIKREDPEIRKEINWILQRKGGEEYAGRIREDEGQILRREEGELEGEAQRRGIAERSEGEIIRPSTGEGGENLQFTEEARTETSRATRQLTGASPVIPIFDAKTLQSATDNISRTSKDIGDLSSTLTNIPERQKIGFVNIDNITRQIMSNMRAMIIENPEIGRSIIESIPVNMMNDFMGQKGSSDNILNDITMFVDKLSVSPESPITSSQRRIVLSFLSNLIGDDTGLRTEFSKTPNLAWLSDKNFSTIITNKFHNEIIEQLTPPSQEKSEGKKDLEAGLTRTIEEAKPEVEEKAKEPENKRTLLTQPALYDIDGIKKEISSNVEQIIRSRFGGRRGDIRKISTKEKQGEQATPDVLGIPVRSSYGSRRNAFNRSLADVLRSGENLSEQQAASELADVLELSGLETGRYKESLNSILQQVSPKDANKKGQTIQGMERRVLELLQEQNAGRIWESTQKQKKELVKQALSEGKPVPEAVLKDYPDLIKQEKAPVTKEPTLGKKLSEEKFANILIEKGIMRAANKGKKQYAYSIRNAIANNRWFTVNDIKNRLFRADKEAAGATARAVKNWTEIGLLDRAYDKEGNPYYAWKGTPIREGLISEEEAEKRWPEEKEVKAEKLIEKPTSEKPTTEEKVEKPTELGMVRLDKGGVKPFRTWKEIKKGINKGKIRVTLTNGQTVIVNKDQVRSWPKEKIEAEKSIEEKPVYAKEAPYLTAPGKLTPQAVEKIVAEIRQKLPNIGTIKVFPKQIDIPDELHERAGEVASTYKTGKMKVYGMYDPRADTIYIVAENMANRDAVVNLILHEAIGHRGVNAILNPTERKVIFKQIKLAYGNTDIGKRIIRDYGLDLESEADQNTFSKELIAHMAQTGEKPTLFDRIIAWVKRALRRAGIDLKISDAEIKSLLGQSYRYAKQEQKKGAGGAGQPIYSKSPKAETLAEENNATYDGRWEDMEGKPYAFTDNVTGSSVMVKNLDELPARLEETRKKPVYSKATAEAESEAWLDNFLKTQKDAAIRKEKEELKKIDEEAINTLEKIKDFATFKQGKVDIKWWDSVFSTPLHYFEKIPGMKRMFRDANKKMDNIEEMLNRMTLSPDGKTHDTVLIEAVKKSDKEGYAKLKKTLVEDDRNQRGYRVIKSIDNQGREVYSVYAPGEYKVMQAWDKFYDAFKAMQKIAENKKIDTQLIRYTFNDETKKWYGWLPQNATSVSSFKDEEEAWADAREHAANDFQAKYGASDAIKEAFLAFKRIADRGFNIQMQDIRNQIAWRQSRGLEMPQVVEVINGESITVNLKMALALMGDRRGYYFPRNRNQGKYELRAEQKGNSPFLQYFDVFAEPNLKGEYNIAKLALNKASPIGRAVRKLKKQGFKPKNITIAKANRTLEDVFVEGANRILNMQAEINDALRATDAKPISLEKLGLRFRDRRVSSKGVMVRDFSIEGVTNKEQRKILNELGGQYYSPTKGEPPGWHFTNPGRNFEKRVARALVSVSHVVDQEAMTVFAQAFMENLADIEKGRGARSHMIARINRRGDDVYRGYEEDPLLAISTYAAGIAGAEAKKVMALDLIRDFNGTDISFRQFKVIKGYQGSYENYLTDFRAVQMFEGNFEEYKNYYSKTKLNEEDYEILKGTDDAEIEREDFNNVNDPESLKDILSKVTELKAKGKLTEDEKKELSEAVTWLYDEYQNVVSERRIDESGKGTGQPNAWRDGKSYITNMLRNDEQIDRLLGTIKGLAVFKFLAGRVSAATVNLTALATTVPAAMNVYANIPMHSSARYLAVAGEKYLVFKMGKISDISEDSLWALQQIQNKKWDASKFNKEALSALESKIGRKWNWIVDKGMIMFGATESLNRGATILGSYNAIRKSKPELTRDEALNLAKEVSDKAHSVYSKANWPKWVRGTGITPNIARSFYVFKSFSHNYLLLMKDAYGEGFVRVPENTKALMFLAVSPAIIAGTGAMIGKELLFALLKAFGIGGDDPEEEFYAWASDFMGDYAESMARYGLAGLAGVSLKGSLSIQMTDLPSTLTDIMGAPGEMMWTQPKNMFQAIRRGNLWKAIENVPFMPMFIANPLKGIRESTEGVTTKTNAPVYYGKDPIMADKSDVIARFFSFSPADIAKKREKQYVEKRVEQRYTNERTDIYARIRSFYNKNPEDRSERERMNLLEDIREYNEKMKNSDVINKIYITRKSINTMLKRSYTPSKKEKLRAVGED